jgi:hypothetical protein
MHLVVFVPVQDCLSVTSEGLTNILFELGYLTTFGKGYSIELGSVR